MAEKKKSEPKKSIPKREERKPISSTRNNSSRTNSLLGVLIALVALQLLVSFIILATSSSGSSGNLDEIDEKVTRLDTFFANTFEEYSAGGGAQAGGSGSQNPQVEEPNIENQPMKGDPNAPILIVEYSDFECPFCARFFSETYPQLLQEYIDTGKVKLVYKDFPLNFHPQAKPAAIAATCVYNALGDEKFFEMHDTIFKNQASLSAANLKTWATELGVATSFYDSCIEDPEVSAEVDADFAEGSALGVSGTPSFVINGELLVGAQPFSAFKQVIDRKLEE